jgi:hypothetical protein
VEKYRRAMRRNAQTNESAGMNFETNTLDGAEGGDSQTLLFYAAFRVFFDFPQYSDTLRDRTIHTVRTNRIIL